MGTVDSTMGNGNWIPKRAVFEATLGCDLRCRHCGSRAGRPRPDELTVDECARVFGELAALGNRWTTISGGEPMARRDWLDIVRAASGAGLRAGMITNALRFDAKAARDARDAGLAAVGFSLDGIGPTHDRVRGRIGHFRRIVEAMVEARGEGMPFAVVTHLNATNLGDLDRMHDLVVERGAYAWQVQLGTEMGNFADNEELQIRAADLPAIEAKLARLVSRSPMRIHISDSIGYFGPNERALRKACGGSCFGGCPAGIRVVGIESNGNVKGCLSIMAGYNARGAEFVEGNIRSESLADIWNREGGFAYTRGRTVETLTGACRDCPQASFCHGGCTAKKVASGNGTENPMCVLRVLVERELARKRAAGRAAAAAVFAGFLGLGAQGCYESGDDPFNGADAYGVPDVDAGQDASADADADADADSDSDADYGSPDTDTNVDEYGIPDTETTDTDITDYGIPDTDTLADTDVDTGVDAYGIPSAK